MDRRPGAVPWYPGAGRGGPSPAIPGEKERRLPGLLALALARVDSGIQKQTVEFFFKKNRGNRQPEWW